MWVEMALMQAALNKRLEEQTGVVQIQRGTGMVAPIRPAPPVQYEPPTIHNSQLLMNQYWAGTELSAESRARREQMAASYYTALRDTYKKHEPPIITEGIEVREESNLLQEITVADGYMRIKHTYFFRPKWWQFWKAPSVTKKSWYSTVYSVGETSISNWCTEDGKGVNDGTKVWLQDIADAYFGRKRAEKAAAKLREVDAKMESPEIAELDPSSPTYNPLKKLRKEKVSE